MDKHRYKPVHSIIAAAVVGTAISGNFWHTFIHGGPATPPPGQVIAMAVAAQVALFSILSLALWLSTRPWMGNPDGEPGAGNDKIGAWPATKTALKAFPAICACALALEWLSVTACEKMFGIALPTQDLIAWLRPGVYPLAIRLLLVATVLVEAPLLEELLFRGIVYRGLCRPASPHPIAWRRIAAALSGFLFAVMHVNAAAFVPLWFLGIAFAWLYRRTGTLLAPICAHFLFNLANLVLCLAFGE